MDIASLLEIQVNEGQSTTDLGTDITTNKAHGINLRPSELISNDEKLYYQRTYANEVSQVRFKRIHCTACDVHIGSAPSDASNMQEHPVLKTLLCARCRDFYGDGKFEQGDDATDMFCRWCANGGNLYCCSYCSNTFCDKCIKRNFEPDVRDKIEADEKWKCFVCDPTDLYALRGLCRAIQHHVVTLARILMSDRIMSPKEIELKMDLDDSKCCIGRRAKRRRHESSSDDDLSPHTRSSSQKRARSRKNNWSNAKRRKSSSQNGKQNFTILNGTSRFIPIAPRLVLQEMIPTTAKYHNDDDDIPAPLLHCEQTMIEGENETVSPQGLILPIQPQSNIPDSMLYNPAISLNQLPSKKISHGPIMRGGQTMIPIRPFRKINLLSHSKMSQVIHRMPNYSTQSLGTVRKISSTAKSRFNNTPPNTPIEIPSVQPSNYLRCKNNLTTQPNVIDLESDNEDLVVLESTRSKNKEKNDGECRTEEASTQCDNSKNLTPTKSTYSCRKIFEKTINNPLIAIDNLLAKLRERLKMDLNSVTNMPDDNEVHNAQLKIKIINRNINKIVNDLAVINNSMIKQYQTWKKSKLTFECERENSNTKYITLKRDERSNKYTPLNMECVCDSESEIEYDEDIDIESLFNFSNRLTTLNDKEMINRGTITHIATEDKSTQAYDTVTMDYDKTIGYSLLMRADYDYKCEKEIFKPVTIHDKYFGKYEEQFISYLQNFEDHRNADVVNSIEKTSPDKTLTELIDCDIAAQKLNVTSDVINTNTDKNEYEEQLKNLCKINNDDEINETIPIVEVDDAEKLIKSTNNVDKNNHNDKMTLSQDVKHDETVIAVRALIEDESNDGNINNDWKDTDDDDECTILE